MKHYSFEYAESPEKYYEICALTEDAVEMMGDPYLCLTAPKNERNDRMVRGIVERLDKLCNSAAHETGDS